MVDSVRVVHLLPSLATSKGGPSRSVPSLCRELARCGDEVSLVVLESEGFESSAGVAAREAGVTIVAAGAKGARLALENADIVHAHGVWSFGVHRLLLRARRAGIATVVSPRGMLEPWALRQKPWRKKLGWHLFQQRDCQSARALHATSEAEAISLRALKLRPPILVVPNGTDVPPLRESVEAATRRILFLSRIHPKKGLSLLIEAVSRLESSLRLGGWHLLIAGPDENRHGEAVRELVRQRRVQDLVQFRGEVNDSEKWEVFASSELFVLPTFSENFGIVVVEALAMGVPVITTTGTPWAELPRERCGWVVPPDVDSITHALERAISMNRDDLSALGRNGRSLVERKYGWPRAAEMMHASYMSLLNRERGGWC